MQLADTGLRVSQALRIVGFGHGAHCVRDGLRIRKMGVRAPPGVPRKSLHCKGSASCLPTKAFTRLIELLDCEVVGFNVHQR